jgi:hypothetical protein
VSDILAGTRLKELERKVAFLSEELRRRDAEVPWALQVLVMRLSRQAWGGQPMHIQDGECAARALRAIEELIDIREQALAMRDAFNAWEAEQRNADRNATSAKAHRLAKRDRVRARESQLGAPVVVGGASA